MLLLFQFFVASLASLLFLAAALLRFEASLFGFAATCVGLSATFLGLSTTFLGLIDYSRSICALRVVEQTEKNIDVSFTLLDVARPKQMLPGWPHEARWPFVGIPEGILNAGHGASSHPNGISGMPLVNPEAVVTDNGGTYRAHKTRDICRQHGIDLLPARAYTPSDKEAVERIFGSIRTMLLERLDGYRGSDTSERGKNVDNEVQWTPQRLEDLLSLWAVMVWQTHIMDDVKPPWCPEGKWSPNALYEHGMEASGLAPKVMTTADYLGVLSTSRVKVHSGGVKIRGLWYDGGILDGRRNQPAPTATKKWAVHYDVRDLRHVWFVDEDNNSHRLRWVGITGEFPAFSERHLRALRNRLGESVEKYTADYLAEVLLTQVLPVRDGEGWVVDGQRADKAASKHARDQELATSDAAKYNFDPAPAPAQVDDALEEKRRVRREAATTEPISPAPRMRSGGGMFGNLAELREEEGDQS